MKTTIRRTALAALLALLWAPGAYAADNATEFGIEDDLTVLGTGGAATPADPDMEVKGFTVFGSTQTAYTGMAAPAAGNVVVNGYLAVSSGAYFVGGSTFAAGGAYFTGVSSFTDVAKVHFGGGAANQVLKKVAGGGMVWADDAVGAGEIAGTARRLVMFQTDGTGGADSLLQQDANDASITMVSGSSLTIQGAFKATGNAALGGTLDLTGAAALGNNLSVAGVTSLNGLINLGDDAADLVTMRGPLTVMGASSVTVQGALEVDGAAKLDGAVTLGDAAVDLLTVNAQSSFVAGSTFSAGAYFTGISSFSNVANVHFGGGTAGQVMTKVSGGGMQWSNVADLVTGDNLGDHTATKNLLMQNNEIMNAGHITASSATLSETLDVTGNANLGAKLNVTGASTFVSSVTARGDTQLGDAITDAHAINQAVESNVALAVKGSATSGQYITKFYSDTSLAAWIRKK